MVLALFLGCLGPAEGQPAFVYSTIDVPGQSESNANGINSSGQIVLGATGSFLLSGGSYTQLNVPGANFTEAFGINDSGQIVGSYTSGGLRHGFLLNAGSYTTFDVPGSSETVAYGVNSSGQIAGQFVDSAGTGHGFLLSGGTFTTLDVPGATSTTAYGINNTGQIVGDSSLGEFLWSGGTYTMLQTPGSTAVARGINDSGQVVGLYVDAARAVHGFVQSGTAYTTLDVPNSTGTSASGINQAGEIVGYYTDAGGIQHAFLATPVTISAWQGPRSVTAGVIHNPSLVQAIPGTYGTKGNYELVVPLASGGIGHYYRNNDDPNLPWIGPFVFATDQGAVDAVSLIQSNFSSAGNDPGNLAVIARIGDKLVYYYRDDDRFAWHGPSLITTGVAGVPSFVQARPGTFGTKGNYELVVPLQSGGIAHYYRNNDDPNLPWSGPFSFGTELGDVEAVSLIQSNFSSAGNSPGNLVVAARIGNNLVYFYRDDLDPFTWHGPTLVFTGVTGNPCLVQAIPGTYGTKGNYELVVPLLSGGIGHFFRNNDDPNAPWSGPVAFGIEQSAADGVSLIHSNFSSAGNGPGNLAVVSVNGNELSYFYRDDFPGTR
jgi:probable HAF family extracellular repeat protein